MRTERSSKRPTMERGATVATRLALLALACVLGLVATPLAASADGAALYQESCAKCHGDDGAAQTPVGKAMKVPSFADVEITPEVVTAAVRENAKHKAIASKVSDADLAAIAAHIATLGGSK